MGKQRRQHYLLLFGIYAFLAAPMAGALVLYHYTNNPFLKPLGITQEKLAEIEGQTDFTSIFVHVDWGLDRAGAITRADLRRRISSVLFMRTDNFLFKFHDVPGDRIGVTFVVGPNRYGPYPPRRVIEGIAPALAALEMTQKANRSGAGTSE